MRKLIQLKNYFAVPENAITFARKFATKPPFGWMVSKASLSAFFVCVILLISSSFLYVSHTATNSHSAHPSLRQLEQFTENIKNELSAIENKNYVNVSSASNVVIVTTNVSTSTPVAESFGGNSSEMLISVLKNELSLIPFDRINVSWCSQLLQKLLCLGLDVPVKLSSRHSARMARLNHHHPTPTVAPGQVKSLKKGGVYLYHVRKAAGSTVRDVLTYVTRRHGLPLFETEGISLDAHFLQVPGLLSVTTLREPISRIMSLYWYEHVAWFHGIKHEPHNCKSLSSWVDAWRDGSTWKQGFIAKNPKSVYVEVENYYVKMLTGWVGPAPVGRADLDKAKAVLEQFDVILLQEWMQDDMQLTVMNNLFPGRGRIAPGYQVRGDKRFKELLSSTLAADEVCVCLVVVMHVYCSTFVTLVNVFVSGVFFVQINLIFILCLLLFSE